MTSCVCVCFWLHNAVLFQGEFLRNPARSLRLPHLCMKMEGLGSLLSAKRHFQGSFMTALPNMSILSSAAKESAFHLTT